MKRFLCWQELKSTVVLLAIFGVATAATMGVVKKYSFAQDCPTTIVSFVDGLQELKAENFENVIPGMN